MTLLEVVGVGLMLGVSGPIVVAVRGNNVSVPVERGIRKGAVGVSGRIGVKLGGNDVSVPVGREIGEEGDSVSMGPVGIGSNNVSVPVARGTREEGDGVPDGVPTGPAKVSTP